MTATAVPQQKQAAVCIWYLVSGIWHLASGIWLVVDVGAPKVTVSAGLREAPREEGHGLLLATEARGPYRARGGVISLYGKLPGLDWSRAGFARAGRFDCRGHQGLCIFITI